jgi:hypothetical protein
MSVAAVAASLLFVIPAKAGIQCLSPQQSHWIPAFAGMTVFEIKYDATCAYCGKFRDSV